MTGITLGGDRATGSPRYLSSEGRCGATCRPHRALSWTRSGAASRGGDSRRRSPAGRRRRAAGGAGGPRCRAPARAGGADAELRRGRGDAVRRRGERTGRCGAAPVRRAGLNGRTLTPPGRSGRVPARADRRARRSLRAAARRRPRRSTWPTPISIDGWYGDAYADLIPDRTDTIASSSASDRHRSARRTSPRGSASRRPASRCRSPSGTQKVKEPGNEPSPILVGRNNTLVQQLVKIGKARLDDLRPARAACPDRAARVRQRDRHRGRRGRTPAGTDAAGRYLARRAPYLWDVEPRRRSSLDDLAVEVAQVPRGQERRGAGGQAMTELQVDPRRAEGEDDRVVRREALPREGRHGARRVPRVDGCEGRAGSAAKVIGHQPGRHRCRARCSRTRSTFRGRWTSSGRSSGPTCCRR